MSGESPELAASSHAVDQAKVKVRSGAASSWMPQGRYFKAAEAEYKAALASKSALSLENPGQAACRPFGSACSHIRFGSGGRTC